ncbi:MAG: WecB/TagA/CpsF family glycosyltransferase [Candidatus Caldatribacteriaceae bacterium]
MRELSLLGYSFFGGTLEELLESVERTVVEGKKLHIITANPEMLVFPDPRFRKVLGEAEIRLPDGIGVVWASRFLGCGTLHRLAGIEVAEALMERGSTRGWSFYFLGARKGVVEEAVAKLRCRYPHLLVCGFHHGYFTEDEEVLEDIRRKCPSVLFVGMGVPRQEMWIARHRNALPVSVFMGVGGSFDVWAGELKRAPTVFRRLGLEWLWRVLQEPRRLRRIVPAFFRFGFALLSEKWWRG